MRVDRRGVHPGRAERGVAVSGLSGQAVHVEQGLHGLSRGEVVDEARVAADPGEGSFVHGIADEPVGAPHRGVEVFVFAEQLIGDDEAVKRGPEVFQVGEQRFPVVFAVGHGKTAVGLLQRQQPFGSGPETAAQQRVVPFEEQDVAQVHERIVRDADRFDMVAPLFDEFLLFPQVILSHGRAVVGIAGWGLLHQFEVAHVGKPLLGKPRIAGHRGEHPRCADVGILHGVAVGFDDSAQIVLRSDGQPLVVGGPPEGERVVENVVPDRFHALVERKGRMFEREGVAQTVNVVNGVFVRFVPPLVRHADAESEPDGVSRLLFGPLLSEHRIVERRGEFSLPVHVRKAAPPRDAVRALAAAVFGAGVAAVGDQRQCIARRRR